jgi:tight adherence protein C
VILLAGLAASFGILLIFYWIVAGRTRNVERFSARMATVADHGMLTSLDELELSRSVSQRVLTPLLQRIVGAVLSRTPRERQRQMRLVLAAAGRPMNSSVASMMVAKVTAAVVGGAGGFGLATAMKVAFPVSLLGLGAGVVGWIVPNLWLRQKAGERRHIFDHSIPDTLDLLTICLDAGLAFDAGLLEVSEKVKGPMGEELAQTLSEMRYGRPRKEALEDMALRMASVDWTDFVNALIMAQQLGAPMTDTVNIQADEIRRRRRQRAEEQAAQASLKMLFPMIGCIFPTLFIVLMGPVAILLLVKK